MPPEPDTGDDRLLERLLAGDLRDADIDALPATMRDAARRMREGLAVFAPPSPVLRTAATIGARGAEAPRSFGRYRLVEELGRGGQGSVWLAIDETDGAQTALKFLDARLAPTASAVARLRRERGALERLSHPGIARIRAAGFEHGTPWIAMDLVRGRWVGAWVGARRGSGF
jgi:hypothetical protein